MEPDDRILDIGCGSGDTVRYLCERGYRATGMDIRYAMLHDCNQTGLPLFQADWLLTPVAGGTMDVVFAECTFSLIEHLDDLLKEIRRVLRTGGKLVFNGMYARNAVALEGIRALGKDCSLGFMKGQTEIEHALTVNGFALQTWEDQSGVLRNISQGEQILRWQGSVCAEPSVTGIDLLNHSNTDAMDTFLAVAKARLGYYLAVAEK
jgi:ubiquinone/menaquinone biosynthesis C-methylase UbiE